MTEPVRVASIGIGWWSNVLADAAKRTPEMEIVSCFTRSEDKRKAFAEEYGCRPAESYEEILQDDSIQGIINTTPNNVHYETTRDAAAAGKHVFLDKPIAVNVKDSLATTHVCEEHGVHLSVGFQRRRESHFRWIQEKIAAGDFGKLVQAEGNISRDRVGQFEPGHWRYQAEHMPGGVMLQIGSHYLDVLEMLMGPVVSVSARTAQLVLPGDNPDVANLVLEHENGALSNLTACYASASEYYMMNIYGKEASAYYDLFEGLRYLTRGNTHSEKIACEKNDTIVEELDEFAECIRGNATPECDGHWATHSLSVILAGVRSEKEKRSVDVAEIMAEA